MGTPPRKKKPDPVPCELIRCPLANIVGVLANSGQQSAIIPFKVSRPALSIFLCILANRSVMSSVQEREGEPRGVRGQAGHRREIVDENERGTVCGRYGGPGDTLPRRRDRFRRTKPPRGLARAAG